MKSWKTTALGALKLVIVLAGALVAFWDGDPETQPDVEHVVNTLFATFAIFSGVSAGQAALTRDNDVTSEDAGAKDR
jgi:hypothetical protein